MEETKKKIANVMDQLDTKLASVRMLFLCDSYCLAYLDKLESTTGIRKCYIAVIVAVNVALAVFFSLGFKAVGYGNSICNSFIVILLSSFILHTCHLCPLRMKRRMVITSG